MSSEDSTPSLCSNGCGFFGNPTTLDMCSKCFREHCLRQAKTTVVDSAPLESLQISSKPIEDKSCSSAGKLLRSARNRCGRCNKKVGLLNGFKCRCGHTYCTAHRYPEKHACDFDFKAAGRDQLAKANPLIKADKIKRI